MPRSYVYILQSESHPDRFYTGFTKNLEARLGAHPPLPASSGAAGNDGCCDYTRPLRPWRIKTVVMFIDLDQARAFERHLKSPFGRAFAKKRL